MQRLVWSFALTMLLVVLLASTHATANATAALLQSTDTADTDGDGQLDEISVLTTGIQVFHPVTGQTSLYPYPASEGSFSLGSLNDTDGVPGVELIVLWLGPVNSGQNGVDIIH